jgi:hypothetical protein
MKEEEKNRILMFLFGKSLAFLIRLSPNTLITKRSRID